MAKMGTLTYRDWHLYYKGCMFTHPEYGVPCYVAEITPERDEDSVRSILLNVLKEDGKWTAEDVRGDRVNAVLGDTKVFTSPALGYRTKDKGRIAVYLSKIADGAQRGLTVEKLQFRFDPNVTSLLDREARETVRDIKNVKSMTAMIFRPAFMRLNEGLEKMRAGEILSFATNKDVLIRPSDRDGLVAEAVFMGRSVIAEFKNTHEMIPRIVRESAKYLINRG